MNTYIPIPGSAAATWKPSVDTEADLPASGNSEGDVRAAVDTGTLYVWTADDQWVAVSGSGGTSFYSTESTAIAAERTYVTLGDNCSLDYTDRFTWSWWIKPSNLGSGVINTLSKKVLNSGTFRGYDFALNGSQFFIHFLSTANSNEIVQWSSAGTFPLVNVWYHVAVTYDGSHTAAGFKIYVNGVLAAKDAPTQDTLSATTVSNAILNFGYASNIPNGGFNGILNSYTLFKGATLTLAQVQEIYNNGVPKNPSTWSMFNLATNHWNLGNGDLVTGFIDSIGGVTGTGTLMVQSAIVPDAPGNDFGGINASGPGFGGIMTGPEANFINRMGIGGVTYFVRGSNGAFTDIVTNGVTWGTIDGRFTPPLLQQNFDLWEFSGSPTHYVGAGAGVSGGQTAPFKGIFGDKIGLAYPCGDPIPTIAAGEIKVKTGTNMKLTADKVLCSAGIGVGNSAAATTPGSVVKKIEVFDASGTSLGFIAVYSSIS